jgi:hypothetical protein
MDLASMTPPHCRLRRVCLVAVAGFRMALTGTESDGSAVICPGPPFWGGLWRHQWTLRFFLYSWEANVPDPVLPLVLDVGALPDSVVARVLWYAISHEIGGSARAPWTVAHRLAHYAPGPLLPGRCYPITDHIAFLVGAAHRLLGGSLSHRAMSSTWRVWWRLAEAAGIIGPHPRSLLPASPARRRFRAAVHAVMAALRLEWLGTMGGGVAMPLHMWRLTLVDAGYPARDRGDAEFWGFAFFCI